MVSGAAFVVALFFGGLPTGSRRYKSQTSGIITLPIAPQFPDSPSRRTDATEREQTRSSRGGLAHARHNSAPARRRGSPRLQRGVAQVSRPRLRHRRAREPLATCPRSSPRVAASESNPSSRTCLTHAWTAMATVAAASDARPRRYTKEQPTAAPFPPLQADFSLAGLPALGRRGWT
jgi:hypothetical protein